MTLGEKFGEVYIGRGTFEDYLVDIADEFAIAFHQWMRVNDTQEDAEKYFHYTDKDMLNAFKEEKGL